MTTFFSHAKKLPDGKRTGSKLVFEHTFGVRDNALRQFFVGVAFPGEKVEWKEFLVVICLFHDLGKYTSFFQKYLLGQPHEERLKQHARFGAQAIFNFFRENPDIAYCAYFIVKNHHRSLHTPNSSVIDKILDKNGYEEVREVFEAQKRDVWDYLPQIESELGITGLADHIELPNWKQFSIFVDEWQIDRPAIHRYFLLNYFFSLLIEGDKLDASGTPSYTRLDIRPDAVQQFFNKSQSSENEHNRLRNAVRQEVLACLDEPDLLSHRLFMLTAPTGIGKTLTALDFALQLRTRLPGNPQIIVGLPFINIIEQTLDVYQKVLPETEAKILGHYQYADIFGEGKDKEAETDEEKDYGRRRMELDTWQSDIVVTSFVQLLQTIIANKNKLLLKFNHLAGAIVIMDEVQSLRLEHAPLVGAVLAHMSEHLGTRFVLMTATKPLIFELAEREIFERHFPGKIIDRKDLLPDPERYFQAFHRTQLVPLIDNTLTDAAAFLEVFVQKWQSNQSCLIVCNTVNRSIEVFEKLQEWIIGKGHSNPLFYLSTNVLPAHRLAIIGEIKKHLKFGAILVSTQVVEAGVDLDFDLGFRDLGPVDSIVQVAGRINRENSPERRYSPLYIVDFGDCKRIYGTSTETQSKVALGPEPVLEPAYFKLVEDYFWKIGKNNVYAASRKVFNGILRLQYDGEETADCTPVGKFRVIEESPRLVSVFVEWDERATLALKAFLQMLDAPDREKSFKLKEDFDKNHKRTFHQHIIAVPIYYCESLPGIDPERVNLRIKHVSRENCKKWYQEPVGFNRKQAALEKIIPHTLAF